MQNFTFDAPTKPEEIQTPVQAEQIERNFDLLFRTFRKWSVLLRNMAVSLTTDISGVLPIANGGTNSSTALSNGRVMVSSGGKIVENSAGTGAQVLHGDLTWSAVPTSSQVLAKIFQVTP